LAVPASNGGEWRSAVKIFSTPIVARENAEIQLFVASEAAITDTNAVARGGREVVDIVVHVVEPGALASAQILGPTSDANKCWSGTLIISSEILPEKRKREGKKNDNPKGWLRFS
jgi:hypothetical protein